MDQAVVFGRHTHLVGVVTHPAEHSSRCDVATIMLTPGMLHNIGPFRMHVDLARRLSVEGIRSLRFDLSGIGESLGIGSVGNSIDRAADEVCQAMDWLEANHGCQRFVLFGLCSGADDSMHTAKKDSRVVGFVAMDGLGFRTKRFYFHRIVSHFLPRLFTLSKWMRFAKEITRKGNSAPRTLQSGGDVREFPGRDEATRQLQSLVDRGARMHFVYTGGIAEYYNYANQFFEMMPDLNCHGAITTKFFPNMDHVALLCEDRDVLVNHIVHTIAEISQTTNPNALTDKDSAVAAPISYPISMSDGIVV